MKAIMVVVGIRPEIVKMAPVIRALQKSRIPMTFPHCGQHYDYNMAQQFIEELPCKSPFGDGQAAERIVEIIRKRFSF